MSVNFKTLRSFVAAVDASSLSAAAARLALAQPALSHQIATLEKHFNQRLLLRSNAGVKPTAAGQELYRHATLILQQLEQAERDVAGRGSGLSGEVSVGLATYSTTSILSTPLLKAVREKYPEVQLFINDNFGLVLSEMVMSGRMDMALIYAPGRIKGVALQPLLVEQLFLIAPPGTVLPAGCDEAIALAQLAGMNLLLPGRTHYLRRLVDAAFVQARLTPRVAAEIESAATLREAIESGLGATVLPWALAASFTGRPPPVVRRVVDPELETTVSLCVSDHLTLSPAAQAVKEELAQVVAALVGSGQCVGTHLPLPAAA
ncbi:MAG: LysR substrate-binding domain-containing protein [Rubrivivax sp.]